MECCDCLMSFAFVLDGYLLCLSASTVYLSIDATMLINTTLVATCKVKPSPI